MAAWNPLKGDLFYAEHKPVEETVEGPNGVTVTLRKQERSYRGLIFRADAQDDYVLLAYNVRESYMKDTPYTFVKKDFNFIPVGPDVAKALNILPK